MSAFDLTPMTAAARSAFPPGTRVALYDGRMGTVAFPACDCWQMRGGGGATYLDAV